MQRIGAFIGILTPIIAFSCILTAIVSYPSFSWVDNALSDLGIISGITGSVFNFGLCFSGALAFGFAVFGLFIYFGKDWVGKMGALTFAATGLVLMGIGFFPENVVPYHYFFSVAFFVLLPISLFVITGAFLLESQTKMAAFTLLMAVATALPWVQYFAFQYVAGVAIPEFASGIVGSVWVLVISYKMLKVASQPKTQ